MYIHENSCQQPPPQVGKMEIIMKQTTKNNYEFHETQKIYNDFMLHFVESKQFNQDREWICNILEHKTEVERIIYEDRNPETGFILVLDSKWNGEEIKNLYCVAVVQKYGIKSIRDLSSKHLSLLHKLSNNAPREIYKKYGIPQSRLKIFFHYPPTSYHLHVHYTTTMTRTYGRRAHMLSTVIKNIKQRSDYYARATLPSYVCTKKAVGTNMFAAMERVYDFRLHNKTGNDSEYTDRPKSTRIKKISKMEYKDAQSEHKTMVENLDDQMKRLEKMLKQSILLA